MDPDWIRIGIQPKMLDPDPYQMNTDPQPWTFLFEQTQSTYYCTHRMTTYSINFFLQAFRVIYYR
jgi:hypothetical protein